MKCARPLLEARHDSKHFNTSEKRETLNYIENADKYIELINEDSKLKSLWKNYQKLNKVEHGKNTDYFCVKVFVKKRYIDVYVESKGRISTINQHINKEIQQFLQLDFNYFMYGKSE